MSSVSLTLVFKEFRCFCFRVSPESAFAFGWSIFLYFPSMHAGTRHFFVTRSFIIICPGLLLSILSLSLSCYTVLFNVPESRNRLINISIRRACPLKHTPSFKCRICSAIPSQSPATSLVHVSTTVVFLSTDAFSPIHEAAYLMHHSVTRYK